MKIRVDIVKTKSVHHARVVAALALQPEKGTGIIMGQACKELPDSFCFDAYVKVFSDLSVVWYVWQPPGSQTPQLERFMSSQLILNRGERKRLESVFEWADRTDPGGKKRTATVKRMWNERVTGETIVRG